MKNLTDYELVKKCLYGEKQYFSEIMQRYKNLVYSIAFKMVSNKEDANDLAQEVFIKIYNNLDKYFPEFKFSTWIIRITTNHIIDYMRKKRCEVISIEDVSYKLAADNTPELQYIKKEEEFFLNSLLDALPEMYKTPLILYHKQGLSYQEIANITNQPLSKVKNRIFRGRKILKQQLSNVKEGGNVGM